ncbi:hypothetical protein Tco_0505211 [Tanacetum coccineum]
MNDFTRDKHFPKKIDNNLKFLNNLQSEWNRSVTTIHQTKDLYQVDYTQLYDFLKFNQAKNAIQTLGVQNVGNQNGLIVVPGIAPSIANPNANQNGNDNVVAARAEGNANGNNGIQLQAKEFDLMAYARDIDEIEEVNVNCMLMANFCYDNEIFNMFTQEDQYTELLEPILEPHQVQQNDSNVILDASSMEQSGGTVDQNPATAEEMHDHFESLYNNLATEVERVNMVNRKVRETNADLTIELARYKRVDNTANTRRPQPRSNTKNDRVPSASNSSGIKNKEVEFLQNILDLYFKHFKLPEDVVNRILQVVLDLQHFKSSLCIFAATSSSAILCISTIDNFVHQIIKFQSILITSRVDNTAKTRRPQPRSDTKNDRVISASKSSGMKNKEVEVEEHHRNLLLSKNKIHISSECNNIKLAIRNDKSEVVCGIVDDYSHYTWVHFLRSKDEAPEDIKNFLKKTTFLLKAPVIISIQPKDKEDHGDDKRLDLTYAPPTITSQKPTERELDLLFEARYDDYIGGQPSAAPRTAPAALAPQVLQTLTTSTTIANFAPTPRNSSPQATNIPNTLHDVNELEPQPQHVQQQDDQALLQPETIADNVSNSMLDGNTFVNPFATPSIDSAESSSHYVDPSNMHTFNQPYPHEYQWTKDHPLE